MEHEQDVDGGGGQAEERADQGGGGRREARSTHRRRCGGSRRRRSEAATAMGKVGERKRSRAEKEREGGKRDGSEGAAGVTRGKSPRAIFPHIIIREGLGVSMATHTPPSFHPSTPGTLPSSPTYIHPLIHSAPRLLICRRTRIGTYAHTRAFVCMRARARSERC